MNDRMVPAVETAAFASEIAINDEIKQNDKVDNGASELDDNEF